MPSGRGFFLLFTNGDHAMDEKGKAPADGLIKVCPKCGESFPVIEEFLVCRNPNRKTIYICKKCRQLEDEAHKAKEKIGVGWCG
jgi:hypothetical protein